MLSTHISSLRNLQLSVGKLQLPVFLIHNTAGPTRRDGQAELACVVC